MKKMNNEVIGLNITMRPINKDKTWMEFVENLVSINNDKGYAFLYQYYALGGLVHSQSVFGKNDPLQKIHPTAKITTSRCIVLMEAK